MNGFHEKEHEIILNSINEFNQILDNGFEIKNINYKWPPGELSVVFSKDDQKIIATANAIYEHILHYKQLYDFKKKKISFVYVPNTDVYFRFESDILPMIIPGDRIKAFITKKIDSGANNKIYEKMFTWTRETCYKKNSITSNEIFSLVCIIKEKKGDIIKNVIGKEIFSIREKDSLLNESKQFDNVIAISFFLLGNNTIPKPYDMSNDMLIGIIIYDLKRKETLAFNIQSMNVFIRKHNYTGKNGFYDIVIDLFYNTVDSELNFKSYPPLPIDSPWYTVLPWICYCVLLPIKIDDKIQSSLGETVNIAEFFTFGYNLLPVKLNTFVFRYFSNKGKGRAICILNLNHDQKRITFNLRFDQSLGERLVHLDFAYYENKEIKLITHKPLDFEDVYKFSFDLFGTMMFAGLLDGYFTTLITDGVKGLKELAITNPALLYPVYFIHILENLTQKLDDRGYKLLEKLLYGFKLEKSESDFIKEINIGPFKVVTEDNGRIGLNLYGYAIITRYRRGQNNIKVT